MSDPDPDDDGLADALPEDYGATPGEELHCVFLDERRVPIREAYLYEIPQPPIDAPGVAWVTGDAVERMWARNNRMSK